MEGGKPDLTQPGTSPGSCQPNLASGGGGSDQAKARPDKWGVPGFVQIQRGIIEQLNSGTDLMVQILD